MRARSGSDGRLVGATIGGIFGAIWLIASADTPLGSAAAVAFRSVGIVAIVFLLPRRRRDGTQDGVRPGGSDRQIELFGRAYWLIVAGESAALAIGFAVIAATGAPSELYRPWTVLVVAVHFIAFRRAGVWQGNPVWPVVPLLAVGAAGFALAYTADAGWVALVTGVGAGLILLGGSLSVLLAHASADRPAPSESRHESPA